MRLIFDIFSGIFKLYVEDVSQSVTHSFIHAFIYFYFFFNLFMDSVTQSHNAVTELVAHVFFFCFCISMLMLTCCSNFSMDASTYGCIIHLNDIMSSVIRATKGAVRSFSLIKAKKNNKNTKIISFWSFYHNTPMLML